MSDAYQQVLAPEIQVLGGAQAGGKEALDRWIAVLARISDEACSTPEIVTTSPHNQATHRLKPGASDDPAKRAMTWRAYKKKRA